MDGSVRRSQTEKVAVVERKEIVGKESRVKIVKVQNVRNFFWSAEGHQELRLRKFEASWLKRAGWN